MRSCCCTVCVFAIEPCPLLLLYRLCPCRCTVCAFVMAPFALLLLYCLCSCYSVVCALAIVPFVHSFLRHLRSCCCTVCAFVMAPFAQRTSWVSALGFFGIRLSPLSHSTRELSFWVWGELPWRCSAGGGTWRPACCSRDTGERR